VHQYMNATDKEQENAPLERSARHQPSNNPENDGDELRLSRTRLRRIDSGCEARATSLWKLSVFNALSVFFGIFLRAFGSILELESLDTRWLP